MGRTQDGQSGLRALMSDRANFLKRKQGRGPVESIAAKRIQSVGLDARPSESERNTARTQTVISTEVRGAGERQRDTSNKPVDELDGTELNTFVRR